VSVNVTMPKGAGPAGTSAAREAAAHGARVVVVERRAVVGVPVQCAEYIPAPLLGEAGVGLHFVVQPVRGMRTFLNGRLIQETIAPGYTIRRDLFDQTLAEAASNAGATILLSTVAACKDDGEVLIRQKMGPLSRIKAKVVVGADGPHSRVGRWIGSVNSNLIPAVQLRVPLTRPMDYTEVFFDDRIYGGYGWLFPKGEEANVGLGMKPDGRGNPKMGRMLEGLISLLVKQGKIKSKPRCITAGWIPAEAPRPITRGNVLLAEDAAGHTHPITGAGSSHAVIGGRMAGKWAARAVEAEDSSLLQAYESAWWDLFGESLQRGFERRQLLEGNWDRLEGTIKYGWVAFRDYYVGEHTAVSS